MEILKIGNRNIGKGFPVFIVAELSANHGQSLQIAKDTIYAAKEAGADAIKLQTYTAETITLQSNKPYFRINHGSLWDGTTLFDLYKEAYTPWEWHQELFDYAKQIGLICFSSPFDSTAVDFLESLDSPAYKIASFEIRDTELIKYAASKHKPVIISTGIAQEEDVTRAINAVLETGNNQIILLKCTSNYPCDPKDMNVSAIQHALAAFGFPVGLSDHSISNTAGIMSVALGAVLIEKHFILDKALGGPDSAFSLDPQAFKKFVDAIREAEDILGTGKLELSEKTQKMARFGRSLFVTQNVNPGDLITINNIRSVRPANGLPAYRFRDVIGKKFIRPVEAGEPLDETMFE